MSKRRQGERAGLSRALVLDAAVELVDREGLDALSMRKLGAALGVEAMTLYHYVPNKASLLDGLVEWVVDRAAAAPEADGSAGDMGWEATLRSYGVTLRATLLAHPGVLPLLFERPASTPQALEALERGLVVLRAAGFELHTALDIVNAVSIFVVGHAMAEAGTAEAERRAEAAMADLPLVRAATGRGSSSYANRFRFGLDALLSGFAATLESGAAP